MLGLRRTTVDQVTVTLRRVITDLERIREEQDARCQQLKAQAVDIELQAALAGQEAGCADALIGKINGIIGE